ncbi:Transcriptional regulator, LacI family [Microbacterium sp. 8M]|jgi:LacI family transcriptional regulator|uniref:LacI family DNA-binding transcriptional regulator n=1 Tax=Microbacterium sp. 8M TaxID=2653153 RepID=UPI0012F454F1|nr:LacI family DNA-binding transcriptional regulator [Microbacterium sp. 8M]VXB09017.1 Transcriptional regulator, LacI family [Microbacterium sp. 8M]
MTTQNERPSARPGHSVTMTDVAERAGVSTATVSRVLNGNYPVAQATKDAVKRAIDDLGYTANAHARALASASTHSVGIIVNDLVDPFFSYIVRGVEQEAATTGRLCIVAASQGDVGREIELIDRMISQRTDAVIVVGGAYDDAGARRRMAERARTLAGMGSTLVLCGRPPVGDNVPTKIVGYDNEGGAFAVTEHLLSLGHRRILYLGGPVGLSTSVARLAGYRRAMQSRGVDAPPELVHQGAFGRRFGHSAMSEILASKLDVTAVFAANDLVAAGALDAMTAAGVRVPEDMSLVGYDDIPQSNELTPKLTTVHVPLEEMGRESVRLALTQDDDAFGRHAEGEIIVGTRLIVRDSVAAPRSTPWRPGH